MTRPLVVKADIRISQGDEEIRVLGHGNQIEVFHPSIRFFFKTTRRTFSIRFDHILTLDQALRDLGLTVVLKTQYLCFRILGINSRKWMRFVFRLILPS